METTTESGTGEAPQWTGSFGLAESGLWLTMRSGEWIKKARYQSNVYAKTEFSDSVILSLPMCQTRVCGDPPRTLCTPVGVASEGQRMSRVGLNSSQGKHLTLNFTVVVRGSKWGDRECGWMERRTNQVKQSTYWKQREWVQWEPGAGRHSSSRVAGQANQTVRGIDSEGGKERNNLTMEVKNVHKQWLRRSNGSESAGGRWTRRREGVSINQSCQEREVAGTHHSFTLKNRSTNSSSKDSTTK